MRLLTTTLMAAITLFAAASAAADSHEGACTGDAGLCGLFEDASSLIDGANLRDRVALLARLAQAAAVQGQPDLAASLITNAEALSADDWDDPRWLLVSLDLAVAQAAAGRDDVADETFAMVLDATAQNGPGPRATVFFHVAARLWGAGEVDAALDWFDNGMAALAEDPQGTSGHLFYQFMPLVHHGMLDQAEALIDWATENDLQIALFASELGTVAEAGRPQLVQGLVDLAHNVDAARDVVVTLSLAVAYANAGDIETADALTEEAAPRALPMVVAALEGNNARAAAVARAASGDFEGALSLLQPILDAPTPFDVVTLAKAAAAFIVVGEDGEAAALLSEAQRLIQDADQAQVIIDGSAEMAIAYANAGQMGDVRRVLDDAVTLTEQARGSPLSPTLVAWLAEGYVRALMAGVRGE